MGVGLSVYAAINAVDAGCCVAWTCTFKERRRARINETCVWFCGQWDTAVTDVYFLGAQENFLKLF